MVNSSPEYSMSVVIATIQSIRLHMLTFHRTKPGLHHLRKRDKPLRTYGRQTATPEAQSEPPSKKQRLSARQEQQEKSLPSPQSAHEPDDAAVAAASEAKPKRDVKDSPRKKKGSILNYFKPALPTPALPTPKNDSPSPSPDSQPEEPIPPPQPSPKPKQKQPTKRKPRLLKIKATTTHEHSDPSSHEPDVHAPETHRHHSPKSTNATTPHDREETTSSAASSPRRTSPRKAKSKSKSSSPSVQTTLNISAQAPFSECKICDTVWNPLYPDDVKYHTKTHKAVLRAQKRKMDDL